MKTLIIGSKGMLGQELVKAFSTHELICWDRDDIDIANQEEVRAKVWAVQPQVIINAAAFNAVDDCEAAVGPALAINGLAPGYLAEMARALNATFIHYSTDYVFDGTQQAGYAETAMPDPISVYAFTKRQGEKRVLESGARAYLIRTSRLFGKPAASANAKKSFVDVMLALAATKPELSLVHEEWSSPTYVVDLALQTKLLIDGRYPFGIYHVTNTGSCSWYEFAREAFSIMGITPVVKPVSATAFPRPARRPAYSILLNTKLPPLRSWQDALRDYLRKV